MNKRLKIAIDCDSAGANLKRVVYEYLKQSDVNITDLNYSSTKVVMYPEIGYNLAMKVKSGDYDRGILICGTGLGMAIIANKIRGVYAGVCHDVYSAERLIKSNNAQILTMGARVIGRELAKVIVHTWLISEFSGGRSQPKVDQIKELENHSFQTLGN